MKTAGDILSALFDRQFIEKARGYSKFFNSWEDITENNGIASAAAHSRIKNVDRGIVLIETDHPGWKQIIQTKQSNILNDFRRLFPELEICGISLMLACPSDKSETPQEPRPAADDPAAAGEAEQAPAAASNGIDGIHDEELKETLKRLEQTIAKRGKKT